MTHNWIVSDYFDAATRLPIPLYSTDIAAAYAAEAALPNDTREDYVIALTIMAQRNRVVRA